MSKEQEIIKEMHRRKTAHVSFKPYVIGVSIVFIIWLLYVATKVTDAVIILGN